MINKLIQKYGFWKVSMFLTGMMVGEVLFFLLFILFGSKAAHGGDEIPFIVNKPSTSCPFIEEKKPNPFKLFDVQEISVNFKNYFPNGRSPYMTDGSVLGKGVDLELKTDLLKYGFWNNKVWSLTDQHQFRWVGWNYDVGVRLMPSVEVSYEHFSRHILEKKSPFANGFPVEDSLNIRFYFYRKNKPDNTIINW